MYLAKFLRYGTEFRSGGSQPRKAYQTASSDFVRGGRNSQHPTQRLPGFQIVRIYTKGGIEVQYHRLAKTIACSVSTLPLEILGQPLKLFHNWLRWIVGVLGIPREKRINM